MRIIAGKHRGRRLSAPKKLPVRPTTDRAKEGLFNILSNRYYWEGISVLDLFSGTGNISFEFASRGATKITAVERHAGCVGYITKITNQLSAPIGVVKSDVFPFLEKHKNAYDIVFADPPYDMENVKFRRIPELVFGNRLIRPEGMLIVEHAPQTTFEESPYFSSRRAYGSSVFSFFDAIGPD